MIQKKAAKSGVGMAVGGILPATMPWFAPYVLQHSKRVILCTNPTIHVAATVTIKPVWTSG
jgi:hypothetical protein